MKHQEEKVVLVVLEWNKIPAKAGISWIENKIVLKDGTIKVCDIKSINDGMLNITQTKDQLIYQAYLVKKQLDIIIENNKYALSA